MISSELIKYIENPNLLTKENVPELQKLVQDFPYFQSAHLLLSMASKKWDATVYQQSLKTTAIVATNRAHLFDLIHRIEVEDLGFRNKDLGGGEQVTGSGKQEETKTEIQDSELTKLKKVENFVEKKIEEEKNIPEEKKVNLVDEVEKEMGKQFVAALVETQLLQKDIQPDPQAAQPESFTDWLTYLRIKNEPFGFAQGSPFGFAQGSPFGFAQGSPLIIEKGEEKKIEKKKKTSALIDKIIESNPGAIKLKEERKFYSADTLAKESLLENEDLITETLAKIYALQGNINKAIRAYEILSLRFPQKSVYFAAQIKKLKTEI